MLLAEYKNKRYTLEELSKYLMDTEHSEYFVEAVLLNKLQLRVFLKECLINDYQLESIEVLKKEFKDKYYLGLRFKNIDSIALLEKYQYLKREDSLIVFLENYHYSKQLYNYNPEVTPYIQVTAI